MSFDSLNLVDKDNCKPKLTFQIFLGPDASLSSHSFPDHNEDDADVDVPTAHWPGESDLHLIKKDLEKKMKKILFSFQKVILKRRDGSVLMGKDPCRVI